MGEGQNICISRVKTRKYFETGKKAKVVKKKEQNKLGDNNCHEPYNKGGKGDKKLG